MQSAMAVDTSDQGNNMADNNLISSFSVSVDAYNEKNEAWSAYLSDFQTTTSTTLQTCLNEVIEARKQWEFDGCGLGLPGLVLDDFLHHLAWARTKCSTFVGRQLLLDRAIDTILAESDTTTTTTTTTSSENEYGVCLSLIGRSGTGKTAVMAKLAQVIRERELRDKGGDARPVLIRFCGTSKGSADGLSLVQSLCCQIQLIVKRKAGEGEGSESVMDSAGGQLVQETWAEGEECVVTAGSGMTLSIVEANYGGDDVTGGHVLFPVLLPLSLTQMNDVCNIKNSYYVLLMIRIRA